MGNGNELEGDMFLLRKISGLMGAPKAGSDPGVSVLEEVSLIHPFPQAA